MSREKWTQNDLDFLKSIYPDYTNEEIVEKYFPNRSKRALESIADKYGFTGKSELAIKKANLTKSKICSEKLSGRKLSEETKQKISQIKQEYWKTHESYMLGQKLSKERREAISKRRKGKWDGENNPRHIDPLYGKLNGNWKGGSKQLIEQLRKDIDDWKSTSIEICNYSCVFTDGRFDNIHHIIPFNYIVDQMFENTGLDRRSTVSDYSENEYMMLKTEIIKLHNDTVFGACLCKQLHELYHKEYSYYNSDLKDFIEFSEKVISGFYDDFFNENNLVKSINYKYIGYLKSRLTLRESA